MTWHKTKGALIGVVAALELASPSLAADPGLTDTEIMIGLFGPLSGPLVGYGLDPVNAAKMWYDDINKKGGVHGRKIRLVIEDDKCTANDLVAVVKKLVTVDNVFMLHGGSCTAALTAAQEYINREKVPYAMLNAAGDNAVIPPLRYTFGAFHGTQRVYAAALAGFAIKELKVKRAAVIVHDDDYGKANLATTRAILKASRRRGRGGGAHRSAEHHRRDGAAPEDPAGAARRDPVRRLSGARRADRAEVRRVRHDVDPADAGGAGHPDAVGVRQERRQSRRRWRISITAGRSPTSATRRSRRSTPTCTRRTIPDREVGPFMITGLPSAMAVAAALEKAGRNLTRESFVAAMESLDFKPEIMAGPLQFGKDRRDAMRSGFVVKYDGKTQKQMPGVYTWNGKDGL